MEQNDIRCSFCGKEKERANKLIAGPDGVYICDECVCVCVDMLIKGSGKGNDNQHSVKKDCDWSTVLDKLYQVQVQVSEIIDKINEEMNSSRENSKKPHHQN